MSHGQFDRLPYDALAAAVAVHVRPRTDESGQVIGTDRLVAEACGVSRHTVMRWRRRGLTWDTADKAACALGLHPASVWHDWFARVPSEDEEAAA